MAKIAAWYKVMYEEMKSTSIYKREAIKFKIEMFIYKWLRPVYWITYTPYYWIRELYYRYSYKGSK